MKLVSKTLSLVLISMNIINCFAFFDIIQQKFPHLPGLFRSHDTSQEMNGKIADEFNFVKRVERYGYTAEEHRIVNQDGYNLILHRISGGPTYPRAPGKKVIYLQHGLAMYTVNYILRGPGRDLVFLLVDQGYDVWMGNARGNAFSRSNVNIPPTNASFWNFSYHEVGLKDVSIFIDETLRLTGQNKLVYIGFSMGTTESFVLFSSLPEYNQKVSLLIELAPVAFWKNNQKIFITAVSAFVSAMQNWNNFFHIQEVLPLPGSESTTCGILCQQLSRIIKPQFDSNRYDQSLINDFDKTCPAGTSAKTIIHLSQNMRSGKFQAYDYEWSNKKIYGVDYAPEYMLNRITAPVALIHSHNDVFTTEKDVELLQSKLPNVVFCKQVPYPQFTHLDFMWANDAKTLVYDDVLDLISQYVNE